VKRKEKKTLEYFQLENIPAIPGEILSNLEYVFGEVAIADSLVDALAELVRVKTRIHPKCGHAFVSRLNAREKGQFFFAIDYVSSSFERDELKIKFFQKRIGLGNFIEKTVLFNNNQDDLKRTFLDVNKEIFPKLEELFAQMGFMTRYESK
jgi:hypothetical protein